MTNPLQAGVDHAELLPCPFCENAASVEMARCADRYGEFLAGCDNERCNPQPNSIGPTKETAIAAWNTRAAPVLPDRGWRPDREAIVAVGKIVRRGMQGNTEPAISRSERVAKDVIAYFLALPDAPAEGAE